MNSNQYIDSNSASALSEFYTLLFDSLYTSDKFYKDLVILCIGTDRSTGDSLGPLVGHKLLPMIKNHKNVHLYGTLNHPVHAQNLEEHIRIIDKSYENPFIIAIDSSLGNHNKVGYLSLKNSPIKPGAAVNKSLPPVGDISITGVVNVAGMMEYLVLQSTRLSLVMTMADIIYKSLFLSIYKLYSNNCALKN